MSAGLTTSYTSFKIPKGDTGDWKTDNIDPLVNACQAVAGVVNPEHESDGKHGDINVTSLTTTGNIKSLTDVILQADSDENGSGSIQGKIGTVTGYELKNNGDLHIDEANNGFMYDKSTGSLSLRNTTHSFGSIWAGIALGGNSTLWGTKARGAGSVTALQSNAYHDGAVYRAISTDEVSSYTLANGEHEFRVAGVTTAGDTVSFTTAMGIVNDGGVIVGSPT